MSRCTPLFLVLGCVSGVRVHVEGDPCAGKSQCPAPLVTCRANGGCFHPDDARCTDFCVEGHNKPKNHIHIHTDNVKPKVKPNVPAVVAPVWKVPAHSTKFQAIDQAMPAGHIFEANTGHYMPPRRISAAGRHQTNKFWTNWISGKPGDAQKPIFTMPYSLKWSSEDGGWKCHYYGPGQTDAWCRARPTEGNTEYNFFGPDGTCGFCHCCSRVLQVRAELMISHAKKPSEKYATGARDGRIAYYISRFTPSYSIGIKEKSSSEHYDIVRENLLGVHAVVRGQDRSKTVRFPVYRGMPYVSGRFDGLTPRIDSPQGYIRDVTKVREGVFDFSNNEGDPDKAWECAYYSHGQTDAWCKTNPVLGKDRYGYFGDLKGQRKCGVCDCCRRSVEFETMKPGENGQKYRAYVMDGNGNPAAGNFANSSSGFVFSAPLYGWLRMAHVINDQDTGILDKHSPNILEGIELVANVDGSGKFAYKFESTGGTGVALFHWGWIHQTKLMSNPRIAKGITHIRAPTKGNMVPILGRRWDLQIDVGPALGMNLLPKAVPRGAKREQVIAQLKKELQPASTCLKSGWSTHECESFRVAVFTNGFYTNGKGLQKLGTLCLIGKKLLGDVPLTQDCANLFKKAFACHYQDACSGVPHAFYDQKWGGIASKQGFTTNMCGLADFGNACYNDHHYHYGYFIHAGAILLQLLPQMKQDGNFVAYINSMIRDIANPSTDDTYFPQFRAFDWYDMHSWSHGVTPSADGKDEESTSEDINAYFGVQMWGKLMNFKSLENTGAMMLSLLAHSASNLFLMKDDNKVHPPDYIKNKVTGIFFESKVHYGTFFGADEIYIHGIQMIPLSPALRLARSKEFCLEEWNQILSKMSFPAGCGKAGWDSLIVTGNLAIINPDRAFDMLLQFNDCQYDKGLTKSWAMYWTASIAAE